MTTIKYPPAIPHIPTVPFVALDDSTYGAVADNSTDAAPAINAALLAMGPGTAVLGVHSAAYSIKSPIIIRNGQTLLGMGAWQGGSTLTLDHASYPQTTIVGSQTMPSDTSTSFTLTVASTAGFPMATGGMALQHGQGVLCVPGFRIFYTAATATTFTGCRVNGGGVSKTLANGRFVSTPAVWLEEPGATSVGFGCFAKDLGIDFNEVPASLGIHTCHAQEGGGWERIRFAKFKLGAYAADSNPTLTGNDQPVNNGPNHTGWLITSSSAEAESVGIDLMLSLQGAGTQKWGVQSTFGRLTGGTQGSSTISNTAMIRCNGVSVRFTDLDFENQHVGVMIGDVYPAIVTIDHFASGSGWGSNTNDAMLQIAGDGSTVDARHLVKQSPTLVPNRQMVVDIPNGFRSTDDGASYRRLPGGAYSVNHGSFVGARSARPAPNAALRGARFLAKDTLQDYVCDGGRWALMATGTSPLLAQDNVVHGARDNSSSTTLTATFTETDTVGNTLLLAAFSAGNFVVSGITDSRGETWTVDYAPISTQGVSVSIARCPLATGHQIGDTLTITYTGSGTYAGATGAEFTGVLSSPVDKTVSNNGSLGTPTTGASATRTTPDQLLYAACSYTNATPVTAGANFTGLTTQSSGAGLRATTPIYQFVGAVGTDAAFWAGQPGNYQAAMVTYKVTPS